jgi:hypothetical protein
MRRNTQIGRVGGCSSYLEIGIAREHLVEYHLVRGSQLIHEPDHGHLRRELHETVFVTSRDRQAIEHAQLPQYRQCRCQGDKFGK